ncbi:MAG: CDP-glycerol glycerophosphotransferase family protein [Lachnospiraceae bacterium]|nr:CDP-glycerol glycerophosphotransferase family protein [Lachnospiraceae bacterium]
MNKNFLKVVFSELVRVGTLPLRLLPIKKNRILFTGLTGGNSYDYSCNPKYLYEYLRDNCPGQYEYVWVVSDKAKYSFLEEEGVKLCKHFTVSSFPMLLTSKIIVTNGSYAPWFPFRKKQYVINTWHGGGAYKKVENETPSADWATRKRAEFCANNIDLFLASCRTQEEQMIKTTYRYKGDILREGTPRNDKMVKGEMGEAMAKVKAHYHIPDNGRIVMYAPTYRKPSISVELDSDKLLEELNDLDGMTLSKLLGVEHGSLTETEPIQWYFFNRYHRYQDDDMNVKVKGEHIIDVLDYPDMQELLCATDILITDYSSCVWDYMLLKRPCFLFVPDKEEYTERTGFYVGLDEWPFDQADTLDDLIEYVKEYDDTTTYVNIEDHLNKLGSYEQGKCCRQIAKRIEKESEKRL